MRSYVVKRLPHFRHSRRRRIESASLLSRESTTLSFSKPQKGHFMSHGMTLRLHCNRRKRRPTGAAPFVQRAASYWKTARKVGTRPSHSGRLEGKGFAGPFLL